MEKLDPDKTHRNITYHKGRSPGSQINSIESGNKPSRAIHSVVFMLHNLFTVAGAASGLN